MVGVKITVDKGSDGWARRAENMAENRVSADWADSEGVHEYVACLAEGLTPADSERIAHAIAAIDGVVVVQLMPDWEYSVKSDAESKSKWARWAAEGRLK